MARKTNTSLTINLPSIYVYKETLQDIFNQYTIYGKSFIISDNTHEYDGVEDFWKNAPPRPRSLRIRTEGRDLYVSIGTSILASPYIEVEEANLSARGCAAEIERILKTDRRLIATVFQSMPGYVFALIWTLFSFALLVEFAVQKDGFETRNVIFSGFAFVCGSIALALSFRPRAIISTRRSRLSGIRDGLTKVDFSQVITHALTGLVTSAITYFFSR